MINERGLEKTLADKKEWWFQAWNKNGHQFAQNFQPSIVWIL